MEIKRIPNFKEIFPDEGPKAIPEYLKGISRATILNVGAFFLGFSNDSSKYDNYKVLIQTFFSPENSEIGNRIFNQCKAIDLNPDHPIQIVNPESSLRLFVYAFENLTDEQSQSNAYTEINIFKAYLLLNQKITDREEIIKRATKDVADDLKPAAILFSLGFPDGDLINYSLHDILVTQVIKAIYLFKYLESQEKTERLLSKFLEYFEIENWEEYFKKYIPLVLFIFQRQKEGHIDIIVTKDTNYNSDCSFMDKLIVIDSEPVADVDFRIIRGAPFYKFEDGKYRIIFDLFVLEKIFRGMYFFLRKCNIALTEREKFSDFRSFYCDEFSEKVLLYDVLDNIFQPKCVKLSGNEIKKTGIEAEPDFYVRKDENVFLFESKDVLIEASIKQSADFLQYESEFKKKFYYDDNKKKKKAILQLINNVRRCLKNEFKFDNNYNYRTIHIYPVLVVSDCQFNTPGFNFILNYWFQNELNKLRDEGIFINRVKRLVVVDIDTFIYHQDLFKNGALDLNKLIDLYISDTTFYKDKKYTDEQTRLEAGKNSLTPFSYFINKYTILKGIRKLPETFMASSLNVFK